MCYSLQASISSLIINIISTIFLLNVTKNQYIKALSFFFAFVGIMQFYDAIFWLTQENFLHLNRVVTKMAMVTNHFQPIILYLLISLFTKIRFNLFTNLVLILYIIFATFYTYIHFNRLTLTKIHGITLKWEWNYFKYAPILYTLFLILLSLISFHLPYPLNILMFLVNIISFAFSYKISKSSGTGRLWCKIAAYIPLILILF